MSQTVNDRMRFLHAFARSPRYVGSVVPSSSHAAAAMVRPVDFREARLVVELGAGTGVFTREIARRLSPQATGLVFERNEAMRSALEAAHPNLELHSDAMDMAEIVRSSGTAVDAVICSLPLANFPADMRKRLAQDIYDVLRPQGKLMVIQYSTQMRRKLKTLFQDVEINFVPLNFPPAFIYTCTKNGS